MENSQLFSLNGRISRMTYWYNCFSLALLFFVIFSFSNLLTGLVSDIDKKLSENKITAETLSENKTDTSVEDSSESKIDTSSDNLPSNKIAATIIKIIVILEYAIYFVFLCFAVIMSVKRWHDRGKSGWMVIISVIVFIELTYQIYTSGFDKVTEGWMILIPVILLCLIIELGIQEGQEGVNKYGDDPLEIQIKFYTFTECPTCSSKYGLWDRLTQSYLCKKCHLEKKVTTTGDMKENLEILFSFKGRFSQVTFWGMIIMANIVAIVFGSLSYTFYDQIETTTGLIVAIFLLVFFIPIIWIILTAHAKRWHDTDRSGWMVFINLIPAIGIIWALVNILFMDSGWMVFINLIPAIVGILAMIVTGFFKGTDGPNKYGEDPLLRPAKDNGVRS